MLWTDPVSKTMETKLQEIVSVSRSSLKGLLKSPGDTTTWKGLRFLCSHVLMDIGLSAAARGREDSLSLSLHRMKEDKKHLKQVKTVDIISVARKLMVLAARSEGLRRGQCYCETVITALCSSLPPSINDYQEDTHVSLSPGTYVCICSAHTLKSVPPHSLVCVVGSYPSTALRAALTLCRGKGQRSTTQKLM